MHPKSILLGAAFVCIAVQADAEVYLARCKMGECVYYEQSERRIEGEGSRAVPGELVKVMLRSAVSENEREKIANLAWDQPSEVHFFCSSVRPAYGRPDGGFQALNLAMTYGPFEMVSNMYLRACHPGAEPGNNIDTALRELGYGTSPDQVYPSFQALIAR